MKARNPAAHYLAGLRQLEGRIEAWEVMPAESLAGELENIMGEVSMGGESGKHGGTLTFSLACVQGQPAPNPEAAELAKSLWTRQMRLQSKAREARFAASVRADVGKRGGKAKVEQNSEAAAIARAKSEVLALWTAREFGGNRKGMETEDKFAMEVLHRWKPILTSHSTVKKWSTEWRKDAAADRQKRKAGESP